MTDAIFNNIVAGMNAEMAELRAVERDLRAEIERLRAALEKAADTFADMSKANWLLHRKGMAQACDIAEKASRAALRPAEVCPYCGKPADHAGLFQCRCTGRPAEEGKK